MNELNNIKNLLATLKPEIVSKFNVSTIGLFGSIVRDDYTNESDVDIIVDFSKPIGIGFIDLADYLEQKINKKIDLVSKKGVKHKYFESFESEVIYV